MKKHLLLTVLLTLCLLLSFSACTGNVDPETGKVTLSGTGAELAQSDEVKKAYLGG